MSTAYKEPTLIEMPNGALVIYLDGGIVKRVDADKTAVIAKIKESITNKVAHSKILDIIDVTVRIKNHSSGLFGVVGGQVYIDSEALPDAISNRIIKFADEGLPFEPLVKFWHNCKLNPDPRAKTDLFNYLDTNEQPITSDGCFIAYRAVRPDFKDKRTGTIDNSVGQVVKMDRSLVDSNPHETCSSGLHAASYVYARNSYGTAGDIVLDVKINPKDVVAIPVDYHNSKMRVCEYEVLAVNENGPIARSLYDNVVEDNDDDIEEENVSVEWDDGDIDTVNTSENWKNQKRDSHGRFIKR